MWQFLGLLFLTTLVLLVIFVGLVYLKAPVYRLTNQNLIQLFEMVLAGEAYEADWDVFLDIPIRYDDELETIRLRCCELTEKKSVFVDSQRRIGVQENAREELNSFIQRLSL